MQKEEKKPIHFETDVERYNKIKGIMEEKGFSTYPQFFEPLIDGASFLNPELLKKLNKLFMEGTYEQKMNFIVDNFLKWHEKFPYLNIQREITPEDAGFLPLECVKPIYWENKFLGFQCIIKQCPIDLPRLSFKDSSGHHITIKVTTKELCSTCVELSKKQKVGLNLFGNITLEQIQIFKKEIKKIKEQNKPQIEREITNKLEEAGIRMSYSKAKEVFQYIHYDNEQEKWKAIGIASSKTGMSRPTIYKLLKAFPKGIH
jgi:hypothetical protein